MGTHRNDGAAAPGVAAPEQPTNDEAPAGETAQCSKGQGATDRADCAKEDTEHKHFATLAAYAEMVDYTPHDLPSGGFLLCRWGLTKAVPALRDVGDMLRRMGAGDESN